MIQAAFVTPHVTVYQGDALEVLKQLAAESVDLCVTSPPYADLVNYDAAASHQARGDSRRNRDGVRPEAYADWFMPFVVELERVLRSGGVLALNLSATSAPTYPEDVFARIPRVTGMRLYERVAWVKSNAAPTTDMTRHLIPSWEPIYVYVKGPAPASFDRDAIRRPYSDAAIARYRNTGSLWNGKTRHARSAQRRGKKIGLNPLGAHPTNVIVCPPEQSTQWSHPARFPEALPAFFIRAYTKPSGLVLDPFAGSGTTLAVARDLGRRGLGVEILPKYVRVMEKRLAQLAIEMPA